MRFNLHRWLARLPMTERRWKAMNYMEQRGYLDRRDVDLQQKFRPTVDEAQWWRWHRHILQLTFEDYHRRCLGNLRYMVPQDRYYRVRETATDRHASYRRWCNHLQLALDNDRCQEIHPKALLDYYDKMNQRYLEQIYAD